MVSGAFFVCGRGQGRGQGGRCEFRLTPISAAIPDRKIVGGGVCWRAIFARSHRPLAIEEMRVGETALPSFADVETEAAHGCAIVTVTPFIATISSLQSNGSASPRRNAQRHMGFRHRRPALPAPGPGVTPNRVVACLIAAGATMPALAVRNCRR